MRINSAINQNIPNILIVDDIPANLQILGDILGGDQYRIREVLTGMLALQVAEKEKPDLILLDIMMPGMDGFEVCRLMKENPNLNDVPIIFISALDDTGVIVKALNAGSSDYITKPFKPEEVKARVATHLKLFRQNKELRKQSIELQRLNAEKNKFFSIIAHDLRGPFNGFLGLTELMAEELSELTMEEIQKIALDMRNSATSLFRLLDNLLDWSRMEQGQIPFKPETVHLLSAVDESMAIFKIPAKKKAIDMGWHISADIHVFADRNMLQAIIRNLVSNAVKYTPKGGKINITAIAAANKEVKISVEDTGIGMSASLLDGIFRLDGQSNRTGTEGEPSTGLGLLLCKEFIEKHGGKLGVESEEGLGSTFYFTLAIQMRLQ